MPSLLSSLPGRGHSLQFFGELKQIYCIPCARRKVNRGQASAEWMPRREQLAASPYVLFLRVSWRALRREPSTLWQTGPCAREL